MPAPELQAIIFDVDGTLAETERDGHRVAFNQAFVAAGLPWQWSVELYGELLAVAGGKERLHHYIQRYQPDFQPTGGDLEAAIAQLHAAKSARYRQLLAAGAVTLRPGVRRLVAAARAAGLRLAIATTSALPSVLALLEQTLEPSWFAAIAAGDMVAQKKPAPDVYLLALQQLDLPAAACVAIEDSAAGAIAARQAGLPVVAIANDYTRQDDFAAATLVLDSFGTPERPCRCLAGAPDPTPALELTHLRTLIAAVDRPN